MFDTVWCIGYLLFIVVAIAIVLNLYDEYISLEDELEEMIKIEKIFNNNKQPK